MKKMDLNSKIKEAMKNNLIFGKEEALGALDFVESLFYILHENMKESGHERTAQAHKESAMEVLSLKSYISDYFPAEDKKGVAEPVTMPVNLYKRRTVETVQAVIFTGEGVIPFKKIADMLGIDRYTIIHGVNESIGMRFTKDEEYHDKLIWMNQGDYVVKTEDNEVTVMKPNVFQYVYEPL
ncbi:hypothetical protein 035JT001_76 [Bacillus phage 035JT001]|nr:hypothetical protein 035JT001_76 [Bacillus phage 035JT001]